MIRKNLESPFIIYFSSVKVSTRVSSTSVCLVDTRKSDREEADTNLLC